MSYEFLISEITLTRIAAYQAKLAQHGLGDMGANFKTILQAHLKKHAQTVDQLSKETFLTLLIQSKKHIIFAESGVSHDKNDWVFEEEEILGDVTANVPCAIFNDGGWGTSFVNHAKPIHGVLAYVPGALLRSSQGNPVDLLEIVDARGEIDQDKFNALYTRRLLPQLSRINRQAEAVNKKAVVTLPGIGTGQFAGKFAGPKIKTAFEKALRQVITANEANLKHIDVIYYDPHEGNQDTTDTIGHISYQVRPGLHKASPRTQQLAYPPGTSAETHLLASFVAWDHFSYMGNDYVGGSRQTDDGVKGASTDTMEKIVENALGPNDEIYKKNPGKYAPNDGRLAPPASFSCWKDYFIARNILLEAPITVGMNDGSLKRLVGSDLQALEAEPFTIPEEPKPEEPTITPEPPKPAQKPTLPPVLEPRTFANARPRPYIINKPDINVMILSGFISVLGIIEVALAFTLLNMASCGLFGALLLGFGTASFVTGASFFIAEACKFRSSPELAPEAPGMTV